MWAVKLVLTCPIAYVTFIPTQQSCIPNEEEPCSQCQQCNSTASYDEVTSERVMRLKVHCKHYKEECEWSGELVALDGHLAHDCQYRKLKCPYGCPENISFCDLEVHKSDECNLRPAEKKADTNSRKIKELGKNIEWLNQRVLQCPEEKADTNSRKIEELGKNIEWLKQCVLRCPEEKADTNSRKIEELTQENRLLKQKLKEQCKNQKACENWIKISWFLLIVLPVITGWCMKDQQGQFYIVCIFCLSFILY